MKCVRRIIIQSGFNSPPHHLRRRFHPSPKCSYTWVRVYIQVCIFSSQGECAHAYAMVINETSGQNLVYGWIVYGQCVKLWPICYRDSGSYRAGPWPVQPKRGVSMVIKAEIQRIYVVQRRHFSFCSEKLLQSQDFLGLVVRWNASGWGIFVPDNKYIKKQLWKLCTLESRLFEKWCLVCVAKINGPVS